MAAVQYVLAHLDFGGKGEVRNVVLGGSATRPQAPVAGAIFYNTAASRVEYFDGAAWQTLAAEVFTESAHDSHDHSAVAATIALNEIGVPTGAVSLAGQRITNVGTPSEAGDAANKSYVDTAVSSEASARAAADDALDSAIDAVSAELASESAARVAADSAIDTRLDTIESSIAGLDGGYASEADLAAAVAAEAAARQAADAALQSEVDAADAAIAAEATRATTAEADLDTRLDAVEADIAALDATYATDAAVASAVAAETSARETADAAIASDVDAVESALAAEVARATAAEAELASDVSDEAAARAAADSALDARVTSVEATIPTLAVAADVNAGFEGLAFTLEAFATTAANEAQSAAEAYADALVQGLDVKDSVKVATTTALLVSTEGATEWLLTTNPANIFGFAIRQSGAAANSPAAYVQLQAYNPTTQTSSPLPDSQVAMNIQSALLNTFGWASTVTVSDTNTFDIVFTTERYPVAQRNEGGLWVTESNVSLTNTTAIVGTAAPTTFSGLLQIDNVTLSEGDRVLVKNENDITKNGVWIASAGPWSRAADGDAGEITAGAFTFVEQGMSLGNTGWVLRKGAFGGPDSWTQFAGAGTYVGGLGISVAGNTISSMLQAGPGLQGNGASLSLNLEPNTGLVTESDPIAPWMPAKLTLDPAATRAHIEATTKVAQTIGDGTATSFTITHSLGADVVVTVRDAATGEVVLCGVTISNNAVTVEFVSAPAADAYRVVVIG
jgi:hypothetical protein